MAPIKEVVFWGAAGQAKMLKECIESVGQRLVALFDNNPELRTPFPEVPLFIGEEGFHEWRKGWNGQTSVGCLVAIGGDKGSDRVAIQTTLERYGLLPIKAIHPTAYVAADAELGAGTQVLPQAAICVATTIGRGCIVNTGATVDHDCRLGDGVHICPGAHLAGEVTIEANAMVGTGAAVVSRVTIGEGAIIGAGAVVIRDVPPHTTVVGNPAREMDRKG